MKHLAALLLICLPLAAQTPKTVFVENPAPPTEKYSQRLEIIMRSGFTDGDFIKRGLKKCSSLTTVTDATKADFIVTPFKGGADMKDLTGKVIFTTKARNEERRGWDICKFGGALAALVATSSPTPTSSPAPAQ